MEGKELKEKMKHKISFHENEKISIAMSLPRIEAIQ